MAADLRLVIQPVLPPAETKKVFQPLADYLTKKTGNKVVIVTAINFLTYWETMKKGDSYDLILDAAHFTDYRAKKMGYVVLAKVSDVVSYSLVTNEASAVLDADELIGKTVATIGSPSLGAVRLEEMYPNPLRQPVIIEVDNSIASIEKVEKGESDAAIVPTPLIKRYPDLVMVTTTEQVPHMALSASPKVPKAIQNAIRKAMVDSSKTPEGQEMIKKINFPSFEAASSKTYNGYASLLEGVWGYK